MPRVGGWLRMSVVPLAFDGRSRVAGDRRLRWWSQDYPWASCVIGLGSLFAFLSSDYSCFVEMWQATAVCLDVGCPEAKYPTANEGRRCDSSCSDPPCLPALRLVFE